jgi:hypothetical protein
MVGGAAAPPTRRSHLERAHVVPATAHLELIVATPVAAAAATSVQLVTRLPLLALVLTKPGRQDGAPALASGDAGAVAVRLASSES